MIHKTCQNCKELKPIEDFHKCKKTKDGLDYSCKACKHARYIRQKDKRTISEEYINYRKEYMKKYFQNNNIKTREYNKAWQKIKYTSNPMNRLHKSISNRIRNSIINKNNKSVFNILPYTREELVSHLEKQFSQDMSWENYGKIWTVDHIIPVSFFSYTKKEDVQFDMCWNINNLQPMLKIENIKKSNKLPSNYIELLEELGVK